MIEVEAALELIARHINPLETRQLASAMSLGHVLAADVRGDQDSPSFDKSMMDGFAVHAEDVQQPETALDVAGTVLAGDVCTIELKRGHAMRIMTGGMIPAGANAVVPREMTDDPPADRHHARVLVRTGPIAPYTHILRQGAISMAGQTIVPRGTLVRSVELGLLAEFGQTQVLVHRQPTAAVIATGNELVPANQQASAGKLRNSNGPMLAGLLRAAGAESTDLGIALDTPQALTPLIEQGLRHDLLVLSGGVSVGDLDLVPGLLKQAGVQQIFHGVRLKPGKPAWFGCSREGKAVFGLPGNPVSSLVCCQLFVRAAIARIRGCQEVTLPFWKGRLQYDHQPDGARRTFWPGRFEPGDQLPRVWLLPWKGSADLVTWTSANCLVDLGSHRSLVASDLVDFMELRW